MKIGTAQIVGLINSHFHRLLDKNEYSVVTLKAEDLLTPNRFDLAFKLAYLDDFESGVSIAKEAYLEHIRAFTLGSFKEPGNKCKSGAVAYVQAFEEVLFSIKQSGFDSAQSLIPVASNGSILNGAHRVSAAIKENICVDIVDIGLNACQYDYRFFETRNVPRSYIDYAAQAFLRHSKDSLLGLVWPSGVNAIDSIDCYLELNVPNLFYVKSAFVSRSGAIELVKQVYFNEDWLGDTGSGFRGVEEKYKYCFNGESVVRVFLFQKPKEVNLKVFKETLRKKFELGKHSLHICDDHKESLRLSNSLLNDNTIDFFNCANPGRFYEGGCNQGKLFQYIENRKVSVNDFVVDAGLVMELVGARIARDIDILTSDDSREKNEISAVDLHDNELRFHKASKTDLIYDPRFHFWFSGVKFISLRQVFRMKSERGEAKDIRDCAYLKDIATDQIEDAWQNIRTNLRYLYWRSGLPQQLIIISDKFPRVRKRYAELKARFLGR